MLALRYGSKARIPATTASALAARSSGERACRAARAQRRKADLDAPAAGAGGTASRAAGGRVLARPSGISRESTPCALADAAVPGLRSILVHASNHDNDPPSPRRAAIRRR